MWASNLSQWCDFYQQVDVAIVERKLTLANLIDQVLKLFDFQQEILLSFEIMVYRCLQASSNTPNRSWLFDFTRHWYIGWNG